MHGWMGRRRTNLDGLLDKEGRVVSWEKHRQHINPDSFSNRFSPFIYATTELETATVDPYDDRHFRLTRRSHNI